MTNKLTISVHQPAYMPWMGYIDRIRKSDIFVFLDNVQFEKNSFINRNKIKTQSSVNWLTVPVKLKGHMSSIITDTLISNDMNWRNNHILKIESSYSKGQYFKQNKIKLHDLLNGSEKLISELCFNHLNFWITEFNIKTKIIRASELKLEQKKSDLILELCQSLGATNYLSGPLGETYLNKTSFDESRIEIEYHKFTDPLYNQLWGDFIPNLSIIDCWMNCGREKLIKYYASNEQWTNL